jgi:hypothetical protein
MEDPVKFEDQCHPGEGGIGCQHVAYVPSGTPGFFTLQTWPAERMWEHMQAVGYARCDPWMVSHLQPQWAAGATAEEVGAWVANVSFPRVRVSEGCYETCPCKHDITHLLPDGRVEHVRECGSRDILRRILDDGFSKYDPETVWHVCPTWPDDIRKRLPEVDAWLTLHGW